MFFQRYDKKCLDNVGIEYINAQLRGIAKKRGEEVTEKEKLNITKIKQLGCIINVNEGIRRFHVLMEGLKISEKTGYKISNLEMLKFDMPIIFTDLENSYNNFMKIEEALEEQRN